MTEENPGQLLAGCLRKFSAQLKTNPCSFRMAIYFARPVQRTPAGEFTSSAAATLASLGAVSRRLQVKWEANSLTASSRAFCFTAVKPYKQWVGPETERSF